MNEFEFIIDNMRFSFSNLNSFEGGCRHGWKLHYIYGLKDESSFYAEFGSFGHLVLEKWLRDELQAYELSDYYTEHYSENVVHDAPLFPKNIATNYYAEGLNYFKSLQEFEGLDILEVENKFYITTTAGYEFTGIKDLLCRDVSDNKIVLIDHKSSNIWKSNGLDKKKLGEYLKQMYIYCADIFNKYGEFPKEIRLNFFRVGKWYVHPFKMDEYNKAIVWIDETINKIKAETEWKPNNNEYFCKWLCGQTTCEFKEQQA
jgi:hypothetical protein